MLKENLYEVQQKIEEATKRANRNMSEVTLIAVSKTKPTSDIKEIYDASIRDFGENKVQELCDKYEELPKDIRWHMIGHLQRNKVKYIVDKAALIHSVDSIRLAEEIDRQAAKKNVVVPILIEVNVAEEESKFGLHVDETKDMIRNIAKFENLTIKGLMTIAPYVVDAEQNRPIFRKIKDLSVDIANEKIDNVSMSILSMGMTNDYEVAIEEGATIVRVGTGIFGQRDYSTK